MKRKPGRSIKHGDNRRGQRSKEYRAWYSIKDRCHNPVSRCFKYYGERGVVVCEQWFNSFETFLLDMGRAPSADHSIDRYPNQSGNYSPENCRWATRTEQARNRKSNVFIEYNGGKMLQVDFAKLIGVTSSNVAGLLKKGRTPEEMASLRMMGNEKYRSKK